MIYIAEGEKGYYYQEERFTAEIFVHNEMILKKYYKIRHIEGLSVYTLDSYVTYLRVLSRNVGKKFENMNTSDIRGFLSSYQISHKMSNYSMDGIRISFKVFFQFLVEEEIISKNPVNKIKKIHYQQSVLIPFTDEEIIMIKDACINNRERALIDFLYSTGCRVSEVCSLDIDDIDFDNRETIVLGKGSKERLVYFDASTKIHLQMYLKERKDGKSALFVTQQKPNTRLKPSGVEYMVKEIGKRVGIKDCYPHKFRRTIATRLLEKGMPIEEVRELLGHSSLNTTLVYAKVNKNSVKHDHSKLLS